MNSTSPLPKSPAPSLRDQAAWCWREVVKVLSDAGHDDLKYLSMAETLCEAYAKYLASCRPVGRGEGNEIVKDRRLHRQRLYSILRQFGMKLCDLPFSMPGDELKAYRLLHQQRLRALEVEISEATPEGVLWTALLSDQNVLHWRIMSLNEVIESIDEGEEWKGDGDGIAE